MLVRRARLQAPALKEEPVSMFLRTSILKKAISAACVWISCCLWANPPSDAQDAAREVRIEGKVRSADASPLPGALVQLKSDEKTVVAETKTDGAGLYVLKARKGVHYQLRAAFELYATRVLEVGPLEEDKNQMDFFLEPIKGQPVPAFELTDEPKFVVSGVTDWSSVGLHGSDANAKTSEALTKEAAALKATAKTDASRAKSAGDAHRLLGDEKEHGGDPIAAVREYETAVRLDPSEENYFAWGTELLLHRAGITAAQVLGKGAEAHPVSERMRVALAAAFYANGQHGEAAREMCRASELNPADPEPYLFLGRMEKAASENLPCSEEKLAQFAKDRPQNASANFYYGLVLWKKARKTQGGADAVSAEEYFRKAAAIEPAFGEVYVELGMMYNARGERAAALAEFQKAVAASPNLSAAHYQLSLAYRRAGEPAKADEEMKMCEKLQKAETAELERARREMKQFVTNLKQAPDAKPN